MNHYEDLANRVHELKFYGIGDEAYYLFQSILNLLYQFATLEEYDKAETLFEWARQYTEENNTWYLAEHGNLDEDDCRNGEFGY